MERVDRTLQKMDLIRRKDKTGALDLEIAKEKAGALGAAGMKLQRAIDRYRGMAPANGSSHREHLVDDIAAKLWALIVQREVVGLRYDNVNGVLQDYDVPQAALAKLGVTERRAD